MTLKQFIGWFIAGTLSSALIALLGGLIYFGGEGRMAALGVIGAVALAALAITAIELIQS